MPKMQSTKEDKRLVKVALAEIQLPGYLMRVEDPDSEEIIRLARSIERRGLIQPIVLRRKKGKYILVAGWRRIMAHKMLKIPVIESVIQTMDDKEAICKRYAENIDRNDINVVIEAKHIKEIMAYTGMTQTEVAGEIGKSDAYVSQRLALLSGYDEVRDNLLLGKINFAQARELNAVKNKGKAIEFLGYALHGGATPDMLREWRKRYELTPPPADEALPDEEHHYEAPSGVAGFLCECCRQANPFSAIRYLKLCPTCMEAIIEEVNKKG